MNEIKTISLIEEIDLALCTKDHSLFSICIKKLKLALEVGDYPNKDKCVDIAAVFIKQSTLIFFNANAETEILDQILKITFDHSNFVLLDALLERSLISPFGINATSVDEYCIEQIKQQLDEIPWEGWDYRHPFYLLFIFNQIRANPHLLQNGPILDKMIKALLKDENPFALFRIANQTSQDPHLLQNEPMLKELIEITRQAYDVEFKKAYFVLGEFLKQVNHHPEPSPMNVDSDDDKAITVKPVRRRKRKRTISAMTIFASPPPIATDNPTTREPVRSELINLSKNTTV